MKTSSNQFMEQLREYSSYPIQPSETAPRASSQAEMDMAIAQLCKAANEYATMPIDQRITLAKSMQQGYLQIAEPSVRAGCKAKGIEPDSPAESEEWATG
ncbi:MAG TPA: hypothetical protein VFF74_09395, partial [Methylophilaceae bacterium]|nr:hypothetical protein [Methylophilaceae bacterium]